jgi:exodeoxyribonuclease VII large subunit
MDDVLLSVSDFVALTNQTLEYAYPSVAIVGEVTEFRVSQGKWVSFKLKDEGAIVNCFTGIYQLRVPLEDGMKIVVVGQPRLNPKWGSFTVSVRSVKPVGEGSIKKGFELLKAKLEAEGLFAPERKRPLPRIPSSIAVITSTESAAYADFTRIVNERWGGLHIQVAHTQVQGEPAADQIIRAIRYFNGLEQLPEVLVIIRGGGSAEDLSTFNDEPLTRAIAESRIPTLVGVGHEVDHTLADMVADVRAATPTHAAETLVPDRREIIRHVNVQVGGAGRLVTQAIDQYSRATKDQLQTAVRHIHDHLGDAFERLQAVRNVIVELNPDVVLRRGYAIVKGPVAVGKQIEIDTKAHIITAEVTNVSNK